MSAEGERESDTERPRHPDTGEPMPTGEYWTARTGGIAAWNATRERILKQYGLWEEFGDRELTIPGEEE